MPHLTSGANKTTYDMITIINKYTGEEICKYSSALVSESTNNSFIAPVKASGIFRGRWNAVVDYFIVLGDGKGGYKYLTELVLVLNHKIFHHYVEKGTEEQNEVASLYNELWRKTNDYALDNLQGEQATYFYHLTD